MTIQEQLNIINENFEKLHGDFLRLAADKDAVDKKYAPKIEEIVKKYQPELNYLETKKNALLNFYRLIKNYTQKNIANNFTKKQPPNYPQLYSMLEKLVDLRSKDQASAHRIADQMVDLINSNVSYLDDKLNEVKNSQNKEQACIDKVKDKDLAMLLERKKILYSNVTAYISGNDVKKLNDFLDCIYKYYKITNDYFVSWNKQNLAQQKTSKMVLGIKQMPIAVPKFACDTMKKCLGFNFSENTKTVSVPVVFNTDSFEEITVEYTDKNESRMENGIQALILNFLRYFATGFTVSLFDYIHYNAVVFGTLAELAKEKNTLIDKVAQDENGLRWSVSVLAEHYRKVETKIGAQTVYEYNKQCDAEDQIPLRLLIINKKDEQFRFSDGGDISYIINNAKKFGITILKLLKSLDGGKKGTNIEHSSYSDDVNREKIISDAEGNFYIESENKWIPFEWLSAPNRLPDNFISEVRKVLKPSELNTKYFQRYKTHLPEKSIGDRKPITLPFGVDDDNNVISCNFENETFAAYMMGASGSGKSTLLHTMIAGILMNYHPDEVELWLLDFKMTEFKRYVNCCPPHVKYILLEKSEDLVFDIIDQLTNILDKRQRIFASRGWAKLTEVPLEENMPAIFVIIDEFAQMSQIIHAAYMNGGVNYLIKLENLLTQGRALGFKFIFASQTFSDGVKGLTDTAKKQIQQRFALKNTPDEIKQTLTLSSNAISPEVENYILSLPPYETLFKLPSEQKPRKYRNMYIEMDKGEIEAVIRKINTVMKPVLEGSVTDNLSYIEKNPILIDGKQPKTFASQIKYYKQFEIKSNLDDGDVFIYPGVPCSFKLAKPFMLSNGTAENILLIGGREEEKISVLKSILKSYERTGNNIEIWAHSKNASFKNYKNCFDKAQKKSSLPEICSCISRIKSDIQARKVTHGLIVCMGYELMVSDFEILGEDSLSISKQKSVSENTTKIPDMNEILNKIKMCSDPEEKRRIIAEYNTSIQNPKNVEKPQDNNDTFAIRDARADLDWILKNASFFGLHFLFYFEQGIDFLNIKMKSQVFKHKILFPMSKEESRNIGCVKASTIDDGVFVYSDGKDVYTMRPHIYHGVPLNGFIVDDNGLIKQQEI